MRDLGAARDLCREVQGVEGLVGAGRETLPDLPFAASDTTTAETQTSRGRGTAWRRSATPRHHRAAPAGPFPLWMSLLPILFHSSVYRVANYLPER